MAWPAFTNNVGIHVRALPQSQINFSISNNTPQIRFTGESGFYFLLQYSDDLVNWTTWTNTTAAVSATYLTPPGFPNPSARFYRAASVQ
jgi:hypothetical protein